jgi:signal transduction histidine kinase
VLPTLVEAIAQALRSPYVGIALHQDQALLLAAEYPPKPYRRLPPEQLQTLPLTHQGQLIGQLQVAPREPGERLSGGDLQLLADLARQAGAAVRAFQLNQELQHTLAELQQSRERLVTAREAERRRLRRDLHDGVGPTLASLIQRIDRVRGLIRTDPDAADQVLTDLKGLTRGALTDIRSLVYALRPPALDEFGLVGALRQHIAQTSTSALKVLLIAPDEPLAVSAAVEVAAYRIAMEALTNAARHAQATTCHLRLLIEEFPGQRHLLIEICDDGMGIAADRQVGVGLTAMNERAAELGGTLTIEPNSPHGTRVIALLPLGG